MTRMERTILRRAREIRKEQIKEIFRIVNFFLGLLMIVMSIIILMFVLCIVDDISLCTFLKWQTFGTVMFLLGILIYNLSEVEE